MQFSMNAQDLLEGLNTVTRALSARPAKQILEGVLMDVNEEGIVLTCSDGSLSIQSIIRADVKEVGRAVLPGRLFTELARKVCTGCCRLRINIVVILCSPSIGIVAENRSTYALEWSDPLLWKIESKGDIAELCIRTVNEICKSGIGITVCIIVCLHTVIGEVDRSGVL